MTSPKAPKKRLVAERRYAPAKTPNKAPTKAAAKRAKKSRKSKPAPKRGNIIVRFFKALLRIIFRTIWAITWRLSLITALIIGAAVWYTSTSLKPVEQLVDGRARGSVTLLDAKGDVFAWRGDQFGGIVTVDTVSSHLKNAIVATEDKRFYQHIGVSPRGVASAVRINLREGRGPLSGHGGSTITQQTAKLLCLGVEYDAKAWKNETEYEQDCRRSTLTRKINEAIYAMAMELKYTKDEILAIYMNRAFLGAGARGFEAAAQRYFGKSAASVTPAEAAMLAGLLKAPSQYAPTRNIERSRNRANVVLALMEDQGYLTPAQAADAKTHPAELSEAAEAKAGGYFADWVMSTGPEFFTRNTTEDVIIQTTLDQRIQTAAESALAYIFENKVKEGSEAQAAIVVMSADGAVRAMVGGRKAKVAGAFNRATQALRQTGSSFKPFVYATALELGASPLDMVDDSPLTINIPGSGAWSPRNYTNKFLGSVTLTQALKDSLNIPAVRLSEQYGRENVRHVAREFGISKELIDSPSLALGASETTLLEMVGAYAGILNGGSSVTPYGLVELRLLGEDLPLMGTGGGIGERVIREKAARELIYMMEKVVAEGSGRRAALPDRQVAGKTGTTQQARDAWFVGFTADYVAGVWMGYDDNKPLKGVTGGGLPAEIWHETMVRVHEGLPARPLPMAREDELRSPQGTLGQTQNAPRKQGAIERLLNDILGDR